MIGRILSHYEILEKLGAGGMGEVYLARDTTLDRDVALKILPAEVSDDPARLKRLQREAKALAALDHPGIVTIFSVEEADGVHFLTMAYIKGQSLAELIPLEGMPAEMLLKLGAELAEALAAAHEQGIVHRDLKPSNVMVDAAGRLRVLDFGLARLVDQAPVESQLATQTLSEPMTQEGMVLGTVPYMSPEQAEGRPVGPSSDLFSLGVVLYEMATGSRPFQGDSAVSLISSILRDSPPPVSEDRPELPEALARIVQRCLEKAPGDRFPNAQELCDDLESVRQDVLSGRVTQATAARPWRSRAGLTALAGAALVLLAVVVAILWWRGGGKPEPQDQSGSLETAASEIRSIAVLPLRNLTGDPEQEYFADGMTEALITGLSKVGALTVIARSSAMRYKGTELALPEIATALGVDAVIEGSVIREGNLVGISAQLIEAATERVVWGEQYERDLTTILSLQGEIAAAIANRIEVTLAPEESRLLEAGDPVVAGAFEATLKGRFHLEKFTAHDWELALGYFENALEIDPDFAPAYVGVADVWVMRRQFGLVEPKKVALIIEELLSRAQKLDPSLADIYASLAVHRVWYQFDWKGGEEAFLRALELNPNQAGARIFYSHLLAIVGRHAEATVQAQRALELDPLNPFYMALQGVQLTMAGQLEQGVGLFHRALESDPSLGFAHYPLWTVYYAQGLLTEAFGELRALFKSMADEEVVAALYRGWEEAGYEGAVRTATLVLEDRANTAFVHPVLLADLYLNANAGNTERAMDWLEKGYEVRDPTMPYLGTFASAFVDEHGQLDLRYQDLLRRMNFPGGEPATDPTRD